MLCLEIANSLYIDACGLLVHFERLQNSCKEKVPKTRPCANCIRKSRKSEDFRPFSGRGDRIGFSGPRRPFGQRRSEATLWPHSLRLLQILSRFDVSLKKEKTLDFSRVSLVVEVTGFEPATFWSRTKRATKLRYTSINFGANEGTRTPDLLITNQLLYQLSHIGI